MSKTCTLSMLPDPPQSGQTSSHAFQGFPLPQGILAAGHRPELKAHVPSTVTITTQDQVKKVYWGPR